MVSVQGPPVAGVIGIPTGEKERRSDFRREDFQVLIETKGPRFAWARAARCPCIPVNPQTRQPGNPATRQPGYNCDLCGGSGFVYFRPRDYVPPDDVGVLTPVQASVVETNQAAVIRGVVTSVGRTVEAYDKLGHWVFGSALVTVRHENKLGYYDKLVSLDSELNYQEVVDAEPGTSIIPTRYLVTAVNFIMDQSGSRLFEGEDFDLSLDGFVRWCPNRLPQDRLRVSIHYLMHPTWLVWEWPHAFREATARFKKPPGALVTPAGDPQALPLQALVRLQFLVEADSSGRASEAET